MSDDSKDDDSKKKPPLSDYEKLSNLVEALNLSPGKKDLLLHRKRGGLFSEQVMDYVEKKLAVIPVEQRQDALNRLKTDVDLRCLMEMDKPGIGKAEFRRTKNELLGFAEQEIKRARERRDKPKFIN